MSSAFSELGRGGWSTSTTSLRFGSAQSTIKEATRLTIPPPQRFIGENFDKIKLNYSPMRVKNLWPTTGVCFLVGPSGCGKSFLALRHGAAIARGDPVLGRKSKPCGVVLVAAEDPDGMRNRLIGLRQEIGDLNDTFWLIGQAPNLRRAADIAELREELVDLNKYMSEAGPPLGMVIIDTLSASIPGADENSATDMSAVLTALQAMAAELHVLVLVIAHVGKDATRGLRGWSGLTANADGTIFLDEPADDGLRGGVVKKVKNGQSGQQFSFRLRVITIGEDADGDPITTCIAEECEEQRAGGRAAGPNITSRQELILEAFAVLGAEGRLSPAADTLKAPEGRPGATVAALAEQAFSMGFYDEPEPQHADALRTWKNSRSKAFSNALKGLTGKGLLHREHDFVWSPMARESTQVGQGV